MPKAKAPRLDDLTRQRLRKEGFPEKCISSYERYGHPAAMFYPLIDHDGPSGAGRVITPLGRGRIVAALGDEARVLLDSEQQRAESERAKIKRKKKSLGNDDAKYPNLPGLDRPGTVDVKLGDIRVEA